MRRCPIYLPSVPESRQGQGSGQERRQEALGRRQRDHHPKRFSVGSRLQDRNLRVVADSAIDLFDVTIPQLGQRAGEVASRLGLSERCPRQGGGQA